MAKNVKRRQRALARQAAKRKAKRIQKKKLWSRRTDFSVTGEWPLRECLIAESWKEPGGLTSILIARESFYGHVAVASFLVDQGCLGVKNAFLRIFDDIGDYLDMRYHAMAMQDMIPCELSLAAKVIHEAINYARNLGIEPHRDYRKASAILGDADPTACPDTIPLGGPDGKPFYVAGPYDNAKRIVSTLNRTLGPDGYTYIVPLGGDDDAFVDGW